MPPNEFPIGTIVRYEPLADHSDDERIGRIDSPIRLQDNKNFQGRVLREPTQRVKWLTGPLMDGPYPIWLLREVDAVTALSVIGETDGD